jgi:holo-[acyl-carrier protein] synthase
MALDIENYGKEAVSMICGVGMDLLEMSRMKKIVAGKTAERFIERILTSAERKLANTRQARLSEFIAGRFAAKEAVVKALGCGIGQIVGFQDIEILPDSLGKPLCFISPQALERLGYTSDSITIHLSITHSESMAAAYAIVEQQKTSSIGG